MEHDSYAFRDRPLTSVETEVLRLVLSAYRDGSGQIQRPEGSMPGFRDYERGLAAVVGGVARENKGVFDVIVEVAGERGFGISCKMASFPPPKHQSSFMELSNSAAKFRDHLLSQQINWATEPGLAGPSIVELITSWHHQDAEQFHLDLSASKYAVLAHNTAWSEFQLLCFPLDLYLAQPKGEITWTVSGRALRGIIDDNGREHMLWQFYPNSGGQLKYWPPLSWAEWVTPRFSLQQPPLISPVERAQEYFEGIWPEDWNSTHQHG